MSQITRKHQAWAAVVGGASLADIPLRFRGYENIASAAIRRSGVELRNVPKYMRGRGICELALKAAGEDVVEDIPRARWDEALVALAKNCGVSDDTLRQICPWAMAPKDDDCGPRAA